MRKIEKNLDKRRLLLYFCRQKVYVNLNKKNMNENNGEIILYQPDNSIRLEVRMQEETVWLTQAQMAALFETTRNNITLHIKNIFKEEELDEASVCKDFLLTAADGKKYKTKLYNLDVIISVGYRVKSKRGTQFRIWANSVLKEYLLRGYSFNQRIHHIEQRIDRHLQEHSERIHVLENKIGFFVRTALPPIEGIFYDGQIFDAYTFVAELIRSAQERVILIDNYVDDSVLKTLTKRSDASIITRKISDALAVDLERHNQQYPPVEITTSDRYHDRFLIIDDTVYHLGASLKDLGKKLFAFNRMEVTADAVLGIPPSYVGRNDDAPALTRERGNKGGENNV